jgi:hypothetical protein
MLLLDLMSPFELEDAIELLRNKLFKTAATKGFSDKRTIEIRKSLDLYINRYNEVKKTKLFIGNT